MKTQNNTETATEAFSPSPLLAIVTVEFECDECGKYEVIKSESTLIQYCSSCGRLSKPSRIVSASVKIDGAWKVKFLPNAAAKSTKTQTNTHY